VDRRRASSGRAGRIVTVTPVPEPADTPEGVAARIIRETPGHVSIEGLRVSADDLTAALVKAFHAGAQSARAEVSE